MTIASLGAIPPPRVLIAGKDFRCVSAGAGFTTTAVTTSCYALTPDIHEAFVDLQRQLNRFAKTIGFKPLALDGKIGSNTAWTVRIVSEYIVYNFNDVQKIVFDYTALASKETIAAQALNILLWMRAFADQGQRHGVAEAPAPMPSTSPTSPASPSTVQPNLPVPTTLPTAAIPPPITTSPATWWIAGGVVAAALAGVAFLHFRRRR